MSPVAGAAGAVGTPASRGRASDTTGSSNAAYGTRRTPWRYARTGSTPTPDRNVTTTATTVAKTSPRAVSTRACATPRVSAASATGARTAGRSATPVRQRRTAGTAATTSAARVVPPASTARCPSGTPVASLTAASWWNHTRLPTTTSEPSAGPTTAARGRPCARRIPPRTTPAPSSTGWGANHRSRSAATSTAPVHPLSPTRTPARGAAASPTATEHAPRTTTVQVSTAEPSRATSRGRPCPSAPTSIGMLTDASAPPAARSNRTVGTAFTAW